MAVACMVDGMVDCIVEAEDRYVWNEDDSRKNIIGIHAKIINNEEKKNGDMKKRNLLFLSFSTFKSNDSVWKILSFVYQQG